MNDVDSCATVAGTTVTFGDLILMGEALLTLAVTTDLMRHETPNGSLDYAEPLPVLPQQVVADFTRWAGHSPEYKVKRERLRRFLIDSGWRNRVLGYDAGPLTSDEAIAARGGAA